MGAFPPRSRFASAVRAGNALLARHGYAVRGDPEELRAWLRTDTPYPNPEPADLLDAPYLVAHEIVEIDEAKRMGLRITRDVIVRHMERINDAHLRASEVELDLAERDGDAAYVASRSADVASWCEDPLLTPDQRTAYAAFRDRTRAWLRAHGKDAGP